MTRSRSWVSALAVILLSVGAARAQTPQADAAKLEQLQQQVDQVHRAEAALDALRALTESMAAEKRYKCISAFGHEAFCGCIVNEIPVDLEFVTYIQIVTTPRVQFTSGGLSGDDLGQVDRVVAARDKCVAQTIKQKP
jgi:hypothetical protein